MKKRLLFPFISLLSLILMASCQKEASNCPKCECECKKDDEGGGEQQDDTPKEPEFVEWKKEGEPFTFTADVKYQSEKPIEAMPLSFEATINIPSTITDRAGVIIGNFTDKATCVSFEIFSSGNPRIYYCDNYGSVTSIVFNSVSVNTGTDLHLAIVDNFERNQVECYVDGELKQTISKAFYKAIPTNPILIGGDLRSGNGQYFKGKIYNVAMYSSVRTIDDLAEDMVKVDKNSKDLIFAYDFRGLSPKSDVIDIKGKNNLICLSQWVDEIPAPKGYAYSMAFIGDTQIVTYKWPDKLHCIYDYVLDKAVSDKIAYCIGLGDITDKNTDAEWILAKNQISRMNDVVPYCVNRGNHDSSTQFNKYFSTQNEFYLSTVDGFYQSAKVENTYRELEISKQKYLIMTLDYGASDNVLAWAGQVIDEHSDYRVIITTHAYLYRDGTTLDQNDVCPPATTGGHNNGDHIWEKFIKYYDNIEMVVCGHDPTDNIVVLKTPGEYGNVVTQILIDPQGVDVAEPTGMVAMFYFSADGNNVDVRYYSTVKNQYLKKTNQMSFKVGEKAI